MGDEGGTFEDQIGDLAEAGELDILRIRDNVESEKRRALIQGEQFVAEAGLFDLKGQNAGAGFASFATLLGGATKAAGGYYTGSTGKVLPFTSTGP